MYSVRSVACIPLLVKQKAVSCVFIMSRLTSPARLDTRSATSAAPCSAACPDHLLSPSLTSDGNSLMQLLQTVQHRLYPQHCVRNNSLLQRTRCWNNLYPTRVLCVVCDGTVYSDGMLRHICRSSYCMQTDMWCHIERVASASYSKIPREKVLIITTFIS